MADLQIKVLKLLYATGRTIKSHKKKLIVLTLLAFGSYLVKKKATIAHAVFLIDKISKILDYLPLPDVQQPREKNHFEYHQLKPMMHIVEAINIEQLTAKVKSKEATWDYLKNRILSGVVLSIVLLNMEKVYFVVQDKYQADFGRLMAGSEFDQMMFTIRENFRKETPLLLDYINTLLAEEYMLLDIKDNYNYAEIQALLTRLVSKVYQKYYNLNKQQHCSYNHLSIFPSAKHLFRSANVYHESSQRPFRWLSGLFSWIPGMIDKIKLLPSQTNYAALSKYRYKCHRSLYLLNLKKYVDKIKWPNTQSAQLSLMVFDQIQSLIHTINFNMLSYYHAQYQLRLLLNRISIHKNSKKWKTMSLAFLMPTLFKILKEEIMAQDKHKDNYYDKIMLKAFHMSQSDQEQPELWETRRIVEEIQMSKQLKHLENDIFFKYFYEREGFSLDLAPPFQQSEQVKNMLKIFSENNQHDTSDTMSNNCQKNLMHPRAIEQ